MKLEAGSPLKPFLGMKQKLNKSGLLIHSLGTIGSSHLGRQTQKQTFTKAQGREATLAEPGDKKWLGGPQILCYPWMPYHSSPVGKIQGTFDPDLDPVI